jgi:hypothetical protein
MRMFLAALSIALPLIATAQPVFVTESSGAVAKANGRPVVLLEPLKPGEAVVLQSGARAVFFVPSEAATYAVSGPADIVATAKGLRAARGSLPEGQRVDEAYRNMKVRAGDAAQGSLILRGDAPEAYLVGPQGPVDAAQSRRFRWLDGDGPWRFELATDNGTLVHRAEIRGNELLLPEAIPLATGVKYVWGITAAAGTAPVDWTEFSLAPAGQAIAAPPGSGASASERVLYAMWLRSRSMPRAASRVLASAAQ